MSEWVETTLGEIADLTIGRTPDRKNMRYWTSDTSHPFCTIADMPVGSWSINPQREGVTQAAIDEGKAKLAPAGSLLMSFKLTIGRVGFAERDVYPNEAIVRIDTNARPDIDPDYLAAWLESNDLTENAPRAVKGKTLNRTSLAAIRVVLPPLPVQERIVAVIGAVDDQIAALDSEARVLDATWWSLGREMSDSLGRLDSVRLDSIASISGGLTKNKKDANQPDLIEVPYLRVANVHRRYLDLREVATIKTTRAKATALRLLPGDVLLNEGGDRDKLGRGDVWAGQIEDCIHQNHVFRVRVTDDRFSPYFVSAWANTFGQAWFETFGTQTTGIASINKGTLSRFPVPDADRVVQDGWVARLDSVVAAHDTVRAEAARLRAVRASLLSALLSRDITINEAEEAVA